MRILKNTPRVKIFCRDYKGYPKRESYIQDHWVEKNSEFLKNIMKRIIMRAQNGDYQETEA